MYLKFLFCVVVSTSLAGCSTTSTDLRPSIEGVVQASEGYLSDDNGNVLVSGDGTCFRSDAWSEANQVDACEIMEKAIPDDNSVNSADVENDAVSDNATSQPVTAEPSPATGEPNVLTGQFLFQSGSGQFSPADDAEMDALIRTLSNYQNIKSINVVGHTDDSGPAAYNQSLSQRRATTVKNKLEEAFPQTPISASGLGETAPVATNETAEGRQQNRRVEVQINTGE